MGDTVYDCNWIEDRTIGKGSYHFKNGEQYEGELKDYEANGYGTLTLVLKSCRGRTFEGLNQGEGLLQISGDHIHARMNSL